MKRLPVLLLVGALIAAMVGSSMALPGATTNAQGTETPAAPAALPEQRPSLLAALPDGSTVVGVLDSSCWLQSSPDVPACEFATSPEPGVSISLAADQQIVIFLDPPAAGLIDFLAVVQPDPVPAAEFESVTIDLMASGGVLTAADLPSGFDSLLVQAAAYFAAPDSTDTTEYFVVANFALEVEASGEIVMATAESTAVALATSAVTAPASTATTAAAVSPPTEAATVIVEGTSEVGVTMSATSAATAATLAGTTAATVQATIPPTNTPLPTATETATPTLTPTWTPSNTPTYTPTPTATWTPSNTPTNTPTPTATWTPSNTPTPTPLAPDLFVRVGGRDFYPLRTVAYLGAAPDAPVNLPPSSLGNTIRILAAPNAAAQIIFTGPRPQAVSTRLRSGDGLTIVEEQTLAADNLVLYSIPASAGSYVLEIEVSYGASRAIYYFRLTVGN